MNIYRAAFIGHREIENTSLVEARLEKAIEALLKEKEYVEFYVGRNGAFDIIAASAVKRMQNKHGRDNSVLILALPYPIRDIEYFEQYYDEVILPLEGIIHPKSAITKRNKWMIDNSNMLLAYVKRSSGGASAALKYAELCMRTVVNLAENQKDLEG